jgi:uncharacterized protein YbjT (DUF2867 family)
MNQTAVVFGATGLVGKELVYELIENKDYLKVIAVVRTLLPISHGGLEQIIIKDYSQLEQFKDQLKADTYFCCIGTTIKIAGSQDAFRKVDYDIPVAIAGIASELGVSNLVVISSVGANPQSSGFYLRTKGEMEVSVKDIFKGNLKIVRPSLLMGHRTEFRFGERAAVIFMKVFGIFMFGPLSKYRGIYAWDVARAMIKTTGLSENKIFVESDELQALASCGGKKPNPHEVIR